ncbi:MAG: response regulator, partial [Betaproteobacteria bacterium]
MARVLIVDDLTDNRFVLRMQLQGDGFAVEEASNGREALALARQAAPDLVISDLLMPGMDGYTLLREWKADETLRAIPFIVYTASYTGPKDEKLAITLGADAFIVKPAKPELFFQRVHDALKKVSHAEPPPHTQKIDEEAVLRLYSEVLVGKLEQKCVQLERRIAELTKSEERIKRLNRFFSALGETNHAIARGQERDTLLETVCRIAVERGGLALAWIGMLDDVSGEVVPVAWNGVDREWFARVRRFDVRGTRHTPVEIALGEERVYVCNDLDADAALAPIRAHLREAGLNAAASCPLRSGGHIVGALTLFAGEKNYFDDTLMDLV